MLFEFCIVPCTGSNGGLGQSVISVSAGMSIIALVAFIMTTSHYEKARDQSLAYDEKCKNDEKTKRVYRQ
ncbi:MAG: hypothetical protein Phog2KO_30600 [Phototrophicaceae bacterium]